MFRRILVRRLAHAQLWRLALACFLAIGALLIPSALYGQTTGTISGQVLDTAGLAIPGARVFVTNEANKDVRQLVTNDQGYFNFAAIPPGDYKIRIQATGFQSWEVNKFHIDPADQRTLRAVKLQVAGDQTSVVVIADTQSVATLDNGERSATIGADAIKKLATEGRNATELIKMLPGMAVFNGGGVGNSPGYDPSTAGFGGVQGGYSANGTNQQAMGVMSDGANVIDPGCNCASTQNINIEMVEEVKVQTSNFGADSAKGPVVINAVGKAGGTSYHGAGYLNVRDASMNSYDPYTKEYGIAKPQDRYLYPGGNFGGPVKLPWTSFNKNQEKMFFFVGYEYFKQSLPGTILQSNIPSKRMRGGDFSADALKEICTPWVVNGVLPNANSGPAFCQVPSYLPDGDPTDPSGATPLMLTNGQVPQSMWDTNVVNGYFNSNFLPLPNHTSSVNSPYDYVSQIINRQNGGQLHGRIDYNFNDFNKLYLTYGRQTEADSVPVNFYYNPSGSVPYPTPVVSATVSNSMSVNYTRVISPTATNELIGSLTFFNEPFHFQNPSAVDRKKLGFNYGGLYPHSISQMPGLTNWNNFGYGNILMGSGFENGGLPYKKILPGIMDNFSKVYRKHTFKAGFAWERPENDQASITNTNGELTFGAPWSYQYTGMLGPISGWQGCSGSTPVCINPVAMMMMGYVSGYSEQNLSPNDKMAYHSFAGYLQDSWKVKSRLTLDLGVRLEHLQAWTDTTGVGAAVFDPVTYAKDMQGGNNSTPGLRWHAMDKSVPLSGRPTRALFVSPRLGMAYDLTGSGKTLLRGGWGAYRYHAGVDESPAYETSLGVRSYSYTANACTSFSNTGGQIEQQQCLKAKDLFGGANQLSMNTGVAGAINALDPKDDEQPLTYSYNATISRQTTSSTVLELAYVGSKTDHMITSGNLTNINAIPVGSLFRPDPITGVVASPTSAVVNDYRPYPGVTPGLNNTPTYGTINVPTHIAYGNYNGFQATWNRTRGKLLYGLNYTWSKALGIRGDWRTGAIGDPTTLRNNYGPLAFDRSQIASSHYSYDVPNLTHGNAVLRAIANGWLVSGITTVQSGSPIQAQWNSNFGFSGSVVDGTSSTANGPVVSTLPITNSSILGTPDVNLQPVLACNPTSGLHKHEYINPFCFAVPQVGHNGMFNMPYIHGPAFFDTDLTVMKNFKMAEKRNLQFRMAGFNFLNHPLTSFDPNSDVNLTWQSGTNTPVPIGRRITSTSQLQNPNFGYATHKIGRRVVELGAKYEF